MDKIATMPNGEKLYFLAGKSVNGDGKRFIWLASSLDKERVYSLWNVEEVDKENLDFWPYKGADVEALTEELLQNFLENAYRE